MRGWRRRVWRVGVTVLVLGASLLATTPGPVQGRGAAQESEGLVGAAADAHLLSVEGQAAQAAPAIVFLTAGTSEADFQRVIALAERQGASVRLAYPPSAFIAGLPASAESALRADRAVARIDRAAVDPAAVQALGAMAARAASAWNEVYAQPPARTPQPPPPPPGQSDVRIPPPPGPEVQGTRGPTARAPTAAQTSAYLAGSVTVSIIYVQSGAPSGNCNPPDPVTERWDDTRRSQVFNQISQGLNFWATRNNRPAAVTFVLDDLGVQLTSCEPINRPSTQEGLWIADVLTRLGVSATPSNYIDPARLLAHQRRTQRGTNWGYLIFVVDSLNNTSGTFTDGAFAYSYLQGPFIVMTYDNDGWGSDRLHFVAAHETGHIFGALDEYASSGCSPSDTGGYFGAPNTSCNNGGITTDVSIMGEPSEQTNPNVDVSDSARAAIGWRNPTPRGDGTAVVDVVRTSTASVQPYSPNPTTNPQPTFNATASNQPAGGTGCTVIGGVTRFCATPVNIARVASAEWQVDGGAWQTAGVAPADGAFDSETENYTFTPPAPVGNGTHTFATRATNNFGHTSAAATTSLTINGSSRLPGDFNNDGVVDGVDLAIFARNYGRTGCGNPADLNGDCVVDGIDLAVFAANYGKVAR